jgi:TRAP-type C4-dicarboxylate transport system substrate-binding protein
MPREWLSKPTITSELDGHWMNRLISTLMMFLVTGLAINAHAGPVTLRMATSAPDASTWVQGMRAGAAEIKERTEGRVAIKYYVGGVQGSDQQVLKKMRIRSLQGGVFTPSAINSQYPEINLYSLPLTFESEEEARYVRARMDKRLIDGLNKAGYISFGFASTGFAMVMSGEPVRGVSDLKGKKVWVPEGDQVSYDTMKALSVSPQPLPITDVLVGLQTKLIDIAPVSAPGALFLQWYTRVKYVTDIPLVYTFGFMVIDKATFEKIDAADQAIVKEVLSAMFAEFDKNSVKDNVEAYEALLNTGIKKVIPAQSEIDELHATMAKSNREIVQQGAFSEELYDEMLTFIEEYRSGQNTAEGSADESAVAAQ